MQPELFQKQRSFNLLRWFSFLSLSLIILITTVSALLLSRYLTHNILLRDAVVTMEFVQTIAQTENATRYFEGGDPGKIKAKFEDFFKRVATMPEVVRAIVYARDGTVIWSDAERFIGQRFSPNAQLEEALSGQIAVRSGRSGKSLKPEHIIDEEIPYFAEIYIPILDSSLTKVVGAVEVYKVPASLFEAIERGNQLVWINVGLGGIFLFVALFWMVRRADQLIRLQQGLLVESETMAAIGEMTSVVAHGIRNPLSSIRSSAEVGLEKNQLAFFREASADIIRETDRLEDWIRELLAYSQPQTEAPSLIQINDFIRSTLESLDSEMKRQNVKLALNLGDIPFVHGEKALLRHVLSSLINNAIEAMPEGGLLAITSRTTPKEDKIEIQIEDTGIGMSKKKAERVFKPFSTSKPGGLGIGLSLAKRIVERYGGTIELTSQRNKGTRVTLQIPVKR